MGYEERREDNHHQCNHEHGSHVYNVSSWLYMHLGWKVTAISWECNRCPWLTAVYLATSTA